MTEKRLQAYKFQLIPTGEQERKMRRFAGTCRRIFNDTLALQQERYKQGQKKLSFVDTCKLLTFWRNAPETSWLAETPCALQQQTLKDLERAYTNFFARRSDHPRFKARGDRASYRFPAPANIKIEQHNNRISLPKIGWLRYRNSREILGAVRNVTVSRTVGKWYATIQTERDVELPVPQGGAVGIDMGTVRLATLSDGSHIEPLDSFRQHEKALCKAQQKMSRKKKGSANWRKAKARVGKIQARIACARGDYLHKLSAEISENAFVVVENLKVKNMIRSAKGTIKKPGTNVRAKSGLNKSILDQGWGELRRQLEYKTKWKGGLSVAVPAQYTSQTCPQCGHIAQKNRPTQANFECVNCRFQENADVVASINVLRAGHAQMAQAQREGHSRIACQVTDTVTSAATGTHRGDHTGDFLGAAQ